MLRPHHKFVDFVEAEKERLDHNNLCRHWQYDCSKPPTTMHGWQMLSHNSSARAVQLLKANPERIDWYALAHFTEATELLRLLPSAKIPWQPLSSNPAPGAIQLLTEEIRRCPHAWIPENGHLCNPLYNLSANPEALHVLDLVRPCRHGLCRNPRVEALNLLQLQYLNAGDWDILSANPAAIQILTDNPSKINWVALSRNPAAMPLLKANFSKIVWGVLSANTGAFELLRDNLDKVYWPNIACNSNPDILGLMHKCTDWTYVWWQLACNPAIFVLDYPAMRIATAPLREELVRNRMHPRYLHQARHDWQLL
jgi:hypothetical protein